MLLLSKPIEFTTKNICIHFNFSCITMSSISSAATQQKFTALRKRLDQLGYRQPLGIESLPLVERLFADLVHTTDRWVKREKNRRMSDVYTFPVASLLPTTYLVRRMAMFSIVSVHLLCAPPPPQDHEPSDLSPSPPWATWPTAPSQQWDTWPALPLEGLGRKN